MNVLTQTLYICVTCDCYIKIYKIECNAIETLISFWHNVAGGMSKALADRTNRDYTSWNKTRPATCPRMGLLQLLQPDRHLAQEGHVSKPAAIIAIHGCLTNSFTVGLGPGS